jgi:hypothetical protein
MELPPGKPGAPSPRLHGLLKVAATGLTSPQAIAELCATFARIANLVRLPPRL